METIRVKEHDVPVIADVEVFIGLPSGAVRGKKYLLLLRARTGGWRCGR